MKGTANNTLLSAKEGVLTRRRKSQLEEEGKQTKMAATSKPTVASLSDDIKRILDKLDQNEKKREDDSEYFKRELNLLKSNNIVIDKRIDGNTESIDKLNIKVSQIEQQLGQLTQAQGATAVNYAMSVTNGAQYPPPPSSTENRSLNLIVHGLPISNTDSELRGELNALFNFLEVPFSIESAQIHIVKLGQAGKESRPVKLTFRSLQDRGQIFRNIKNLKNATQYDGVRISDDLTPSELKVREDLLSLAIYCRDKGYDCKVRNDKISINDRQYTLDGLNDLPDGITMEAVKTVEVDDGQGLAFQGPWSYLSNLHNCKIEYGGYIYTSVEQGLTHQKAIAATARDILPEIMATTDGFKLKRLAKDIILTSKWEQTRDKVLFNLMLAKFKQNVVLKDKLLATGKKHLFEAVKDRHYGCGFTLREKEKISVANNPFQNQTGKNLMLIRSQYLEN